jgi:molybdopterin-containing oxidoreductase family iron-sulfur binding subunit
MSASRELTFEDVLRYAGREATRAGADGALDDWGARSALEPAESWGDLPERWEEATERGGCSGGACRCQGEGSGPAAAPASAASASAAGTVFEKPLDRRRALAMLIGAVAAGTQAAAACSPVSALSEEAREAKLLEWEEYFKGRFELMSDGEKAATVGRLERLAKLRRDEDVAIKVTPAQEGVLFGYAFNISKCQGYRNCVQACIEENNLDRAAATQYIRIFEFEAGEIDLERGDPTFAHEVPAEGHFYMGTQCFQCANPPCVSVCPVRATWQEPDGITVVDYDWCIGCRYCMAACPYWARRFNWSDPVVPAEELNPTQHYLGNRARKRGVVEKCHFCVQRTREGRLPACAEACPTGARVFGNLLDPSSEIRWVLEHKQVFRLKEELGTEPRFWYFMD